MIDFNKIMNKKISLKNIILYILALVGIIWCLAGLMSNTEAREKTKSDYLVSDCINFNSYILTDTQYNKEYIVVFSKSGSERTIAITPRLTN